MHVRIVIATLAGAVLALGCSSGSNNGDGGSTTPARLSAAGESCARTADCAADLVCMSQQCVTAGTTATDGGTPATVRASGRGEECMSTTNCAAGLVCWGVMDPVSPYSFGGRCDYANFGVTATGKTCSAECLTNADCMELPIPDQSCTLSDGGTTICRTCQDLTVSLSGVTCSEVSSHQRECFLYAAYCSSTSNPWTCTAGTCAYSATCTAGKGSEVVAGCPAYTRSGTTLPYTTCNSAGRCAASNITGCTSDDNCVGKPVADDTDTCSTGECICHAASGGCYRKCANDLECAKGFVCGSAHYCVASDSCSTDAFCAVSTNRASAKCVSGTCKVPCSIDLECSPSGLFLESSPTAAKFDGQVCHSGYCESVGCSSDSECSVTSGSVNVKTFCVTPPAASTTATPHSAITN